MDGTQQPRCAEPRQPVGSRDANRKAGAVPPPLQLEQEQLQAPPSAAASGYEVFCQYFGRSRARRVREAYAAGDITEEEMRAEEEALIMRAAPVPVPVAVCDVIDLGAVAAN